MPESWSFSVNVPSSKKLGQTISISERPLEVPTVIIDDKNQLQDTTTGPMHEGPLEGTTQSNLHQPTPQTHLVVPSLGDIPSMVQGDDTVTTSGTPLHDNVLILEANASSQPAPPEISEEPHSMENVVSSTVFDGTSVPSGEKGLLKGKAWFCFVLPLPSLCDIDIFLEFSAPHHLNDELMLGIMRGNSDLESLHLTRISTTKWKALGNIEL